MSPPTEAIKPVEASIQVNSESELSKISNSVSSTCTDELISHLNLLKIAREHNDRRLVSRVLHHLPAIRHRLTAQIIINLLNSSFITIQLSPSIQSALTDLQKSPESDEVSTSSILVEGNLIERNVYILLLISVFLLDNKFIQGAMESSTMAVMFLQNPLEDHLNTFDPLLSRHFYFLSRAYELANSLPELHNFLMVGLRTASLRHDNEAQATVYNCILRLHLIQNDYGAAVTFLKNSPFPSGSSNLNNQSARFMFYRARIYAVSGNYFEASEDLNQALRKVPHGHFALNFILSATKFSIVVQLLRGEIPERSVFNLHSKALKPYLELTQSVRLSELASFQQVVNRHVTVWTLDDTKVLVERLHESVLRVGLRRLSQAYTKISFSDISKKLGLNNEHDALVLVKKALAEGVIVAKINETLNYLESNQSTDLYSTKAPQEAFSTRTQVLQNFHNEAVRAMRFPEKGSNKLNSSGVDEERRPSEEELMDEFMDADDEMF